MENERVIYSHELRPGQTIRIFALGAVDNDMVDALKAFAELQEKLANRASWRDVQTPVDFTVGIPTYPENALFKTPSAST